MAYQLGNLKTIEEELIKLYPHARPRLIQIFLECIELHAKKTHDYNGKMDLYRATGVKGRFCDIWRKVIRLFNAIMNENKMMVDESLKDTANDLIVYSALLIEELEIKDGNIPLEDRLSAEAFTAGFNSIYT